MSTDRERTRTVLSWLRSDEHLSADRILDSVLDEVSATPQRPPPWLAWRPPAMSNTVRLALAATAVVVAALIGYRFLVGPVFLAPGSNPSQTPVLTDGPSSPAAVASPGGTPLDIDIDTNWTSYTSSQYGLTIAYPRGWTVDPAERAWDLDADAGDPQSPGMEDFIAPGGDVRVSVWALPADPDMELTLDRSDYGPDRVEAWIEEEYCPRTGSSSCAAILDGEVELCIEVRDCHPGVLVGVTPPFVREVQAFMTGGVVGAEHLVVVTIWRTADDSSLDRYGGGRRLMEAFLEPLCVWPRDDRPAPSPEGC